jgi:sulfopyruvate decarboxylase alpha subunit
MASPQPQWPDDIFRALRDLEVRQVAYVPDGGHARLIEKCHADNSLMTVPLTTEEEGIGLLAGAWLGGKRGALLMQSSGVGNCVNLLAMARTCRFPLLMVVTLRGDWGERSPWHLTMGQTAGDVLKLLGSVVHRADEAARVGEAVTAAGEVAFNTQTAAAALISQRVIGVKEFR